MTWRADTDHSETDDGAGELALSLWLAPGTVNHTLFAAPVKTTPQTQDSLSRLSGGSNKIMRSPLTGILECVILFGPTTLCGWVGGGWGGVG